MKALLEAIIEWNDKQTDGKVVFCTQLSVDAAKDEDLLRLCSRANLNIVFVGIETPNEDSLREMKKRQNVGVDLAARIQKFLDHGIGVVAGMMTGFDSDGLDIFRRQYEFAMSLPVPIFSLGPLVAPDATPLNERMRRAGRLIENEDSAAATPWNTTNIIPKKMSREQLLEGVKWLCEELYHPSAFAERVNLFIDKIGKESELLAKQESYQESYKGTKQRPVDDDIDLIISNISTESRQERSVFTKIYEKCEQYPHVKSYVNSWLWRYAQIRYMYEMNKECEHQLIKNDFIADQNIQILTI